MNDGYAGVWRRFVASRIALTGLAGIVVIVLVAALSVAAALYIRYLKRISAHLMNIASSVVNPFERIGFKSEGPDAD